MKQRERRAKILMVVVPLHQRISCQYHIHIAKYHIPKIQTNIAECD
jgi:hypothetical protein